MKTAVFFERDGVLNQCETVRGHQVVPRQLEEFRVVPEAAHLLAELKTLGFLLIATTNQPGISRGDLRRNEVDLMHTMLRRKLPLDDIFLCGSDDPTHPSLKPNPGMLLEAAFKWSLDLDHCFVVSDKWQDAKAAQIAGCTSIMIRSPWTGTDHHDFVVESLSEAIRRIIRLHQEVRPAAA